MNTEKVEKIISSICSRTRLKYGDYHTISPGKIGNEPCPVICFRVGDVDTTPSMQFDLYYASVGSTKTILKDENGNLIAEYKDITKSDLM